MHLSFFGALIYLFTQEITNLTLKSVIISLTLENVMDLLHNLEKNTKRKEFSPLVDGLLGMKKTAKVIIKFWRLW